MILLTWQDVSIASSVFNTVDHSILHSYLSPLFNVGRSVVKRCVSCLTDNQSINIPCYLFLNRQKLEYNAFKIWTSQPQDLLFL